MKRNIPEKSFKCIAKESKIQETIRQREEKTEDRETNRIKGERHDVQKKGNRKITSKTYVKQCRKKEKQKRTKIEKGKA